MREEVQRRGRDAVLRAYLPGYLFARFALDDPRWGLILHCREVQGILGSVFGRPAAVPDAAAGLVFARFDDRDMLMPDKPPNPLDKVGQEFTVQTGPWAKFVGRCERVDPKGRVTLLLGLFGRPTLVEFRPEQLEAK